MNHNFLVKSLLYSTVLFASFTTDVRAQNFGAALSQNSMHDALHEVDPEMFLLVKNELESAKKVLIEIRNTQNPALIKKAASSLGNIMRELLYVGSSIALGGGSTLLGICLILGIDIQDIFNHRAGQATTLIVLPVVVFSVIITYAFLKLILGNLLGSANKDEINLNIKDALGHIDQTINKLDYEMKKIERLHALQKSYNKSVVA